MWLNMVYFNIKGSEKILTFDRVYQIKVTPHDEIADFIIFDIFIDSY